MQHDEEPMNTTPQQRHLTRRTLDDKSLIELMFGPDRDRAWVAGFKEDPRDATSAHWYGGRYSHRLMKLDRDGNGYVSLAMIQQGRSGRVLANVEYVCGLMIDDVGTKFSEEAVTKLLGTPNVQIETSPGNFQLLYLFDQPLRDVARHSRIMNGVAQVLGRKESPDPARYFRLPGFLNTKGGQNFRVVAEELTLAGRHGVEVYEAMVEDALGGALPLAAAGHSASGEDSYCGNAGDRTDTWIVALGDLGWIKRQSLKPGVVDITCPFVDEHTGAVDNGAAYLGRGRFECHHGHCASRTSPDFQARVLERHQELVGFSGMKSLASAVFECVPVVNDRELDQLASRIEQERAEREELEWEEIFGRFVYVRDVNKFTELNRPTVLMDDRGFAVAMRKYHQVGMSGVKAAHAKFLNDPRARVFDGLTYVPGEGREVRRGNRLLLNKWSPSQAVPEMVQDDQEVELFLKVLANVAPDKEAQGVLLDFMTFVLTNPGVKINWAPVIKSEQGPGKGTLFAPFVRALGDNVKVVTTEDFADQFNAHWVETQVLYAEEMALSGAGGGRFDLYNKMKPYVAAPPDTLTVKAKYMTPYVIENRLVMFGFTNKDNAIALEASDRRFWVYESPGLKLDDDLARQVWDWYENKGGLAKVHGWLRMRTLGAGFNPKVCPPEVGVGKANMLRAALALAAEWVSDWVEDQGDKLLAATDVMRASSTAPASIQRGMSARAIADGMRAAGYAQLRQGVQIRYPNGRARLWCPADKLGFYEQMTNQQLISKWQGGAAAGAGGP